MIVTYMKKIKNSMLCVTGVYLRDITNTFPSVFARECKSCEYMLVLVVSIFLSDLVHTMYKCHIDKAVSWVERVQMLYTAFTAWSEAMKWRQGKRGVMTSLITYEAASWHR